MSPPDLETKYEAFLAAKPTAVSSIMGLFPPAFVARLKERGIAWFACATTLAEARAAEAAGADAIVTQGLETGGHRGSFDQATAERQGVDLFALLPRLSQSLDSDYCDRWHCRRARGRLGRAIETSYVRAANSSEAPKPRPYPIQRSLTAGMRQSGQESNDVPRIAAWAGQSAALARPEPASEIPAPRLGGSSSAIAIDVLILVTLHEEVRELMRPSAGAPRSGAGRPVTGTGSTARASKANAAVNYRKLDGVREFRDRSWLRRERRMRIS